ncbi:MAG: hypothetical protein ACOCRX_01350 [Candidatus Woesearchaeota archaeon]
MISKSLFKEIKSSKNIFPLNKFENKQILEELHYDDLISFCKQQKLDINNIYIIDYFLSPICYIDFDNFIYIELMGQTLAQLLEVVPMLQLNERIEITKKKNKDYSWRKKFCIIDSRVIKHFFDYHKDNIPDNELYNVFVDVYGRMEYGFEFDEEFIKRVDNNKPDEFYKHIDKNKNYTIYRGEISESKSIDEALSWSCSKKYAIFFATRFNEVGTLYKAEVKGKDIICIICYIKREEEVLVFPNDIMNMVEVSY